MENPQCFVCGDDCNNSNCYLVNLQSKKYKSKYTALIGNLINAEYELRVQENDRVCDKCILLLEHYDELEQETKTIKSVLARQIAQRYTIETDQELIFLDKSKVFFPIRNARSSSKFNCRHCPSFVAENIDVINAHILYHQYHLKDQEKLQQKVVPPLLTKKPIITREVPKTSVEVTKIIQPKPASIPSTVVNEEPANDAAHNFSAVQECEEDTLDSLIDLSLLENEYYDSNLKDNSCTVKNCSETFCYASDYVRHLKLRHKLTLNQIFATIRQNLKRPAKMSKLTCPYCFTKMSNSIALEDHIQMHEVVGKPSVFINRVNTFVSNIMKASKCKVCDCDILDPTVTECSHEIVKNGMARKIDCKYCNSYFYSEKLYNNHLAMLHFECFFCEMKCEDKILLKDHIRSHLAHTEYPCSFCNEIYQTKKDMSSHIRMKHSRNCCIHCGEWYADTAELETHLRYTHADKRFKEASVICDTCGISVKNRLLYDKHLQTDHKAPRKIYKCSKCPNTFDFRYLLMDHFALIHKFTIVDNEANFYKCCFCSQTFSSQNRKMFVQHLHKHQTSPSYCHNCEANFDTKLAYEDHREKAHQDFSRSVNKTPMIGNQGKIDKIDEPPNAKGVACDQLKFLGKEPPQKVQTVVQPTVQPNVQLIQEQVPQQQQQQQVIIQGEDGSLLNMNNLILTENGELIIQNFDGLLPNGATSQDGEIQINNLEQFLLEQGISSNTEISYIQSDDGTMVIHNDDGSLTHTTQESLLQTYKEIFEPDEITNELIGEEQESQVIDQQNILMNGDYIIQPQVQANQVQVVVDNQAQSAANQSTLDELGDILLEVAAAAEKEKKPKGSEKVAARESLWGKKRSAEAALKESTAKRRNGKQPDLLASNEPPAQNFSQAYELFVKGFDAKKMKQN